MMWITERNIPKGRNPPVIQSPLSNRYCEEAFAYVESFFKDHPGIIDKNRIYPITFEESALWLEHFLHERFNEFGIYEDAIVKEEIFLNHSLLSPLMNAGLISPREVINQSLLFAKKNEIPLNSLEGFIRQIMGWREFIRGMYVCKGSFSRTQNSWGFERKIPQSFYDGTTGIEPVDDTIKKVLSYWLLPPYRTAYGAWKLHALCANSIRMRSIVGLWNCLSMRMTGSWFRMFMV